MTTTTDPTFARALARTRAGMSRDFNVRYAHRPDGTHSPATMFGPDGHSAHCGCGLSEPAHNSGHAWAIVKAHIPAEDHAWFFPVGSHQNGNRTNSIVGAPKRTSAWGIAA